MNREIKFRIYDKCQEKMYEPASSDVEVPFAINAHGDCLYLNPDNFHTVWARIGYIPIIMQYIGLKDKNGKEIWEGDVVVNKAINVRGEVFYNPLYCRFMIRDLERLAEKCDCSFQYDDEVEVIGNIYENPELLYS